MSINNDLTAGSEGTAGDAEDTSPMIQVRPKTHLERNEDACKTGRFFFFQYIYINPVDCSLLTRHTRVVDIKNTDKSLFATTLVSLNEKLQDNTAFCSVSK